MGFFAAAFAIATSAAPAASDETPPAADFLLASAHGTPVSLIGGVAGRQLTVLAWTSTGCPITKLLAPRLGRLERDYRDRGVRFLGIDPNIQDSPEEVRAFAANAEIAFPILLDPQQVVT